MSVSRLGTYGNVTVGWTSTRRGNSSERISPGTVRPPSGFIVLTTGEEIAEVSVKVCIHGAK